MRKQVLEYDDVANDQRKVIYHQRAEILLSEDIDALMQEVRHDAIVELVDNYIPPNSMEEQWDISGLEHKLVADFNIHVSIADWLKEDNTLDNQDISERLLDIVEKDYAAKVELAGIDGMRRFERNVMLQIIDTRWLIWTICVRVYIYAVMLRKIRNRNINVKHLKCFRPCGITFARQLLLY